MIRKMCIEDLPQVLVIEKTVFHPGWNEKHFVYELTENPFSFLYVLEENHKIVGYVGFWEMFEQAQITTIAVDQTMRNKGYGKMLLSFVMQEMKRNGCELITLEVRKSNVVAQQLYASFGFVVCGERKNYYGDEDAILMGVGI